MSFSVIILTFDEEIHIERCIASIRELADRVYVVDSGSTDATRELAEKAGALVFQNPWPGSQAAQFDWALDHLGVETDWILRMDADETVTPELIRELREELPMLPGSVSGVTLPLKRYFLGRHMKHGLSTIRLLRLFRNGKGRYSDQVMDEHLEISDGEIVSFEGEFVDDNKQPLFKWLAKHIGYAERDAMQKLAFDYGVFADEESEGEMSQYSSAVIGQKKSYAKAPLFLRSFVYFFIRYVIRLGFLDGKEGFLWHFLQAWWYRTIIDVRIYEIKADFSGDPMGMRDYIRAYFDRLTQR